VDAGSRVPARIRKSGSGEVSVVAGTEVLAVVGRHRDHAEPGPTQRALAFVRLSGFDPRRAAERVAQRPRRVARLFEVAEAGSRRASRNEEASTGVRVHGRRLHQSGCEDEADQPGAGARRALREPVLQPVDHAGECILPAPMSEAARGNRHRRRALCVLLCVGAASGLAACGGGDSGAEELARQREIAEARHDAAQDARQAERVKQLGREVDELKHGGESTPPAPVRPRATTTDGGEPAATGKNLGDWPGGSGYSAMLGAFSSEANARDRQGEAVARGLDAGVLYSSEFSSLRPGYWVVFSGDFETESEAVARVRYAQKLGYSDSYPRFVSP
jgi:cell division septation protein DedD